MTTSGNAIATSTADSKSPFVMSKSLSKSSSDGQSLSSMPRMESFKSSLSSSCTEEVDLVIYRHHCPKSLKVARFQLQLLLLLSSTQMTHNRKKA